VGHARIFLTATLASPAPGARGPVRNSSPDMTRGPASASRGSRLRGARALTATPRLSGSSVTISPFPHRNTRHGLTSLPLRTSGLAAAAMASTGTARPGSCPRTFWPPMKIGGQVRGSRRRSRSVTEVRNSSHLQPDMIQSCRCSRRSIRKGQCTAGRVSCRRWFARDGGRSTLGRHGHS
jgi:hypothetical protein